ncbi:ABC transporter, ATP-binding protein [Clostridium bornimense]|uniref:ABC transporter, ATP-binding protein n=1 Tax=Clostridium bornimense TaxID=1216932 RepID=W6S1Q7_9CLOT|nr:ABC transporter ATP-binding protein [Clostridium bornimense]CDM69819.1 ABC transporter, ATP-binding protein [Clostridium bornimense]
MDKVIEIKSLTKNYGTARGINNINFSVGKGDIFGFVGPNGAGKSTTIRTTLGLIKPDNGFSKVFGKEIYKGNVEVLRNVGYMPSEAMFYPNMKVDEIIKLSQDIHKKDCSAYADELCERLQVDRKKKIDQLSLGNRKKVSIVCAMQHKPELYILDEPTSGLDPLMQKEFFNLLIERNNEGATILLSSHILTEVQRYCNRVAIIREGNIVTVDSIEELSASKSKKVKLVGAKEIIKLEGMSAITISEEEQSFLYNGEVERLVKELGKIHFEDITIEEPSLEEIFINYYEKEEK